jgi:hypothetical protein
MPLTSFFLDYFPGYNKFRTVSMILVIAGFTIPLLASIGLNKIFSEEIDKVVWKKAMIWSVALTAGISLVFFLIPGLSGSFVSASDSQMPEWIRNGLVSDRTSFLRSDALRSFALILAVALVLWVHVAKKIQGKYALLIIGTLILVDMWGVNKRYLNDNNFVQEQNARNPYPATKADKEILKDKTEYRVLNLSTDPFNEASTSYYHHSIGGYHGAKMRRYQELINLQIDGEIRQLGTKLNALKSESGVDSLFIGLNALNMLNTKYMIYNPEAGPIINSKALGNAWVVNSYQLADNADQEIAALGKADLRKTIVVDKKYQSLLGTVSAGNGSNSKLSLTSYSPNKLVYNYSGKGNEIAVFSEIYYPKGWNAYFGDKLVPYFQANYVLRAMVLQEGTYDITFKFEPLSYRLGKQISMVSSLLLLIFIGFVLFKNIPLKKSIK